MGRDPRQSNPRGGLKPKFQRDVSPAGGPPPGGPQLTVMTWNLYFGSDLSPVIEADTKETFVAAVATAFNEARASNFAGRATAWADQIEKARPDLIGLQEAAIIRTQSPSDWNFDPPTATVVDTDMLELLLAELQSRGLEYGQVKRQIGQDIEAPGAFPTGVDDIRLTHSVVILARKSNDLRITNLQGGRYDARVSAPTAVGATVELYWAWAAVDVTFQERSFRFATTHLDPEDWEKQRDQVDEFLRGPGMTSLPIVLVGDLNSDADGMVFAKKPPATDTYQRLMKAGYRDAWTAQLPDRGGGFTCCQDPSLKNDTSNLDHRVDFVLIHGALDVVSASVVGDDPADRDPSGLWPSDHAGVVATLQL